MKYNRIYKFAIFNGDKIVHIIKKLLIFKLKNLFIEAQAQTTKQINN